MSEYIKKEDLFERTINRNSAWNTITDSSGWGLEEIVNDLPTYSFPDSAENKGEDRKIDDALNRISAEINTPNRGTCDYFIVDRIEQIISEYREGVRK